MSKHRIARLGMTLATVGLLAVGCATSDDPREGGLFGYWATGEAGYEKRLDEKRESVETLKGKAEQAEAKTAALEAERDQKQAALDEQKALLDALEVEVTRLGMTTAAIKLDTDLQRKQRDELQQEMTGIQDQLKTIRSLPLDETLESAVQDRRRKLGELQKELRLLRERASLLTTL